MPRLAQTISSGLVYTQVACVWASQVMLVVKNLPASAGDVRLGFDPLVGTVPWRREWQPTPVLLPGEYHGQRSLVGYGPQGLKELDTTEVT